MNAIRRSTSRGARAEAHAIHSDERHRRRAAPFGFVRALTASVAFALLLAGPRTGEAQAAGPAAPIANELSLSGTTLSGQPISLADLRGKVVLVWFWSTACAVCRDVLPELRANYAGWHGKPFELLTVATDPRLDDVLAYERIARTIVPLRETIPAVWRHQPGHRDTFPAALTMPTAFLIDSRGRVVERFVGRIPPEAWDRVAELLP